VRELKKHRLSGLIFIGSFIVLLGISIIAEALFGFSIPASVFFGVFFVLLGLRIIFKKSN